MKIGRNLSKIRRALIACQRADEAIYVERVSMDQQRVMRLSDKSDDQAPYFAMLLLSSGWARR
jgi:precorrin-2/cobalt-factor-2 C20-methyltransferase